MNNVTLDRIGRLLGALVVLFLLADGAVGLFAPHLLAQNMAATGWAPASASVIGGLAALAALLYAVPQTAMLGAILVTGFCGGAIATHVRIGEAVTPPVIICVALAALAWAGLYLREASVRTLLPLRS